MGRTFNIIILFLIFSVPAVFGQPKIPLDRLPEGVAPNVKTAIKALYLSRPLARGNGVIRLGKMGKRGAPAIPFLISILSDVESLEYPGRQEPVTPSALAIESLLKIGLDAVPPLKEAAKAHKETLVRKNAIKALGRFRPDGLVNFLTSSLLSDHDPQVRLTIIEILREMKDKGSVAALVKSIDDKYWAVGQVAVETLGLIGDPATVLPLIKALSSGDSLVRENAVQALARLKDPRAISPMLGLLSEKDWMFRRTILVSLREFRDPSIAKVVSGQIKDLNSAVRREALITLLDYNNPEMGNSFIELLSDDDSGVRYFATKGLGQLKDINSVDKLTDISLHDLIRRVRVSASNALYLIGNPSPAKAFSRELLDSNDMAVRENAAEALGNFRSPEGVAALIQVLGDMDTSLRKKAVISLGQIGDPRALDKISTLTKDRRKEVRKEAVLALAKLGDKRAIPVLKESLNDKKGSVRKAAKKSLLLLGAGVK